MKKITLLLMVAIAAINMSAATITIPEEAKAWNIPAEAIDVLQAREICAGLEADVPTTKMYYVMGYVKRVSSKNAETVSQYGQARFYLENVKGANSEEEFDAYQVYGLNGVKINNPDVVAAGDFVVLYGPLTKHQYEGGDVAYQTPGKGAAYIWNSTNPKLHNDTGTTPDTPETPEEPVAKVVTVAEFNAAPEATDVYYELTGTIGGTINTTYGNFDLTDETGTVYVYGLTKAFIAVGSTQNDKSYSSLGLKEGDKITIRGFRGSYNGKIEVMGAYFVKLVEAGSGTTPPTPPTPPVGDLVGDGTPENPYTVEDVIALNNTLTDKHYVKGFIIGQVNGKAINTGLDTEAPFAGDDGKAYHTNIVIASAMGETTNIVPVQLPSGDLRKAFNLVENPDKYGVEVLICGELIKYFGVPGVKNPTSIEVIGGGDPNVVNVEGMQYADASYYTEDEIGYFDFDMYVNVDPDTYEYTYPELYVTIKANSKTALNGTYDLLGACLWTSVNDSIEMGEALGTVTIKNVDTEGNYSFKGSFVGADGKTYKFNDEMYVWGFDYDTEEEIVFSEESTGPVTPPTPPTGGAIVFDASVDQGDAPIYADGVSGAQYTVTKNNVTLTVSSGVIGTANSLTAYRIYKGSTLTVSSSAGNIKSIVFTCTAENDAKQGPGCFTVDGGDYTYAGTVGTWTGDAATITFTASTNQVRATQIVVTLANATAVEDVTVGATPVKVIENGQVLIIRGEHIYNVLGAQVK